MDKMNFAKVVASGNDFVVITAAGLRLKAAGYRDFARKICDRKYGVGADGLLILEESRKADIRMRIFNADGSEAEMCGNGARCLALYMSRQPRVRSPQKKIEIETKAGIISSEVNRDNVKIKLTEPKDIKLDIPVKVNNRRLKVNFVNTGVPHTVIFVEGLDKIDVVNLGRQIRYHPRFRPQGTNVDFAELLNNNSIKVRTYERGVEDETLACGTGAVAASLIAYQLSAVTKAPINVLTRSGEMLKVYFKKEDSNFSNVWLEGKARIVYKGVYYV